MANNNYDYLVRLGVDQSEINRVIANLDAAFGKQYKLKVDTSDLSEVSQVLSNLTKAMDSVKTSLPEVSKIQEKTADAVSKAEINPSSGFENFISATTEKFNQAKEVVEKIDGIKGDIEDTVSKISGIS
ncbi:MAG: hypothetical protein HFG96_12500 [Lachnospiraceae bacterium]|jgi:hypothetical protein|nr:hypothetical protein [Lachnospiraceae bacterium]